MEEASWFIQWSQNPESEEVKVNSCIMLASLAYPDESVSGLRERILDGGFLQSLLDYAAQEVLQLHREIDPSEIELESQIAQGASAKIYTAKWKGKTVCCKVFDPDHISFSEEEFKKELGLLWFFLKYYFFQTF